MIRFDQQYITDGLICGSVILDNEPIGEFRVGVAQWDALHEHETDDVLIVFNEEQGRSYREQTERDEALA